MIEKYWRSYKWQNGKRYYNIYLQHNLLGIWSVINAWGNGHDKAGKYKISFFHQYSNYLY